MGQFKLTRTILRRFRLLVFDQSVIKNGTIAFGASLTTRIFPLLISSLVELSCGLEMPSVEVLLGLLFGGFQLEQRGKFYESPIWVKCFDDQAMTLRQDGQLEAGKLGLAK